MSSDPSKRKSNEHAVEAPPAKVSIKLTKTAEPKERSSAVNPIRLNIASQPKRTEPSIKPPNAKVKEVFNSDEESEEEEIPEEARIRMRNLGRFTPTSCGPNSYGKSKFGFIDRKALLDRQTEALNEYVSEDNQPD